jgi:hypothetical protein
MAHMRFYQQSSWLVVATIAYLFFMHLGSLNGQLLSDSFSLIYNCYGWHQADQMAQELLSLFYRSNNESGGSFMFRPLAIASLCGDYLLWGEQAFAHKLIQLLWHVGNGILLYVLLARVSRQYQLDVRFASVTACLFLLSHLTPEISVWVAGRFDALVQTCLFLCLYAFWAQKRFLALLFLILALLSKESAIMIVPMLISLSFFRHWGEPGSVKKISQESGLFIILLILYFIYRWIIFGQTTQVYPQSGGLIERFMSHAMTFPTFLWRTMFASVNQTVVSWLYVVLLLSLFGYSLYVARKYQILRLWFFVASGIAIVLLALLTQVGAGESSGTGARLLYIMIPWQVALLSLPLLFDSSRIYRLFLLGFLLLGTLMHCWVIQQWTTASQVSKNIVRAVPEMAASVDKDNWSLLLVPDHIGPALLARNAQGAMVLPPFQQQAYLDSVVPFIWRDLELWRERANSSFVNQFKNNSEQANERPLYAMCWSRQGGYVKQVIKDKDFKSKLVWQSYWENLINSNACYF